MDTLYLKASFQILSTILWLHTFSYCLKQGCKDWKAGGSEEFRAYNHWNGARSFSEANASALTLETPSPARLLSSAWQQRASRFPPFFPQLTHWLTPQKKISCKWHHYSPPPPFTGTCHNHMVNIHSSEAPVILLSSWSWALFVIHALRVWFSFSSRGSQNKQETNGLLCVLDCFLATKSPLTICRQGKTIPPKEEASFLLRLRGKTLSLTRSEVSIQDVKL